MHDIQLKIQQLIFNKNYNQVIKLIDEEIEYSNGLTHWLLANKAYALYELKNYEESKIVISKALVENDKCPFVWWHLACILEMNDQISESITIWQEIIGYRKININYDANPCWEGPEFKKALIIDSIFRVGRALSYLEQEENAKRYLKIFIKSKQKNEIRDSIYSIDDALELLKRINKSRCISES